MSSGTGDRVLAGPLGECCFKMVQHKGTPAGKWETIFNIETYVTGSKENGAKRILLYYADVWGPTFINNQLVADYFASRGWLVLALDYFRGDPITLHRASPGFRTEDEPGWDPEEWKTEHMDFSVKNVPGWVDEVKAKYGGPDTKYVSVGYCFGAPHVMNECAKDTVVAGAIAHPAFLNESHIQNSKKPIFFSCAEVDHTFPPESRHITEKILAENKQIYHFQLFSGVAHGFALRGNPDVENERWAKEHSAKSIADWFDRFAPQN